MKRWIIFGLFVTSVLCIGAVAYIRFCTNLRRQAIRDLETFTISLGGRFNTDLQDGGSWVYLDNVIITKTQAHEFAAISRKRRFGLRSFGGSPIYLSLRDTKCEGPIGELLTESVWYCSLEGQQLTIGDIQELVDRAPDLSQLSLASTNVDDEMLGPLRHSRLNSLDIRGTSVTARGLCSLFSQTKSPPIVYSELCDQDKRVLKECGVTCLD